MIVDIFCEESQEICKAFRARGHIATSYDLKKCSGGHPEWHVQDDIKNHLHKYRDLAIFHPVCKFISNSGVRWLHTEKGRWGKLAQGIAFFNLLHCINSPRICTENPIPHKYAVTGLDWNGDRIGTGIGIYDQIIQPWQFGHKKMKATCFWLKGLPPLIHTDIVGPPPKDKKERYKWQDVWTASPGPDRERLRSVTYSGIAKAMASQWG